ncbi:MAG: hypothetical protein Q8920_14560 [Bacillota bacterium]|nr:hypothetical protein [Bacillota bacterium]
MAVVIIGLALYICFSNIRLYNDRIEIKNFITKTTYFKDVSTLDIVGYNLIFRDSDQEALLALPIQNIVLDLTALLNFIRKHNPHVQLGASFIPEDKISEIIGQEDGDS